MLLTTRAYVRVFVCAFAAVSGSAFAADAAFSERIVDAGAFGAVPNDAIDDTDALQAALDSVRGIGGTVRLSAGEYLVSPRPGQAAILRVGSRLTLEGVGPASTLKVRGGAGEYQQVIGAADPTTDVENLELRRLRIDQNPEENGSADVRVGVPGKAQFAIHLTRFHGVRIESVVFDRATGVNTVSLNGPATRGAVVKDCVFRFQAARTSDPSGTYDNSAIYIHGKDFTVEGNRFETLAPAGRARTAIEVHGARGVVRGNTVFGYQAGCHVMTHSPEDMPDTSSGGIIVANNVFADVNRGVNLWSLSGLVLRDVVVMGNTISVAQSKFAGVSHAGVALVRDTVSGRLLGDFEGIVIANNTVSFESEQRSGYSFQDSGGIVLYPEGSVRRVAVTGNVVRNAQAQCVRVQSGGGTVEGVVVNGNVFSGCAMNPAGQARAAIVARGTVRDMFVTGNAVMGVNMGVAAPWLDSTPPASGGILQGDNLVTGGWGAGPRPRARPE